jgi:NDP-sugar pyrophosphorylase family protein
MLNIVIPMAGRGSRFRDVGFSLPKPLIPLHGRAMVDVVVENLRPSRDHRFIFLCLAEHLEEYEVAQSLRDWAPGCEIVSVDSVTEGAACTVLLAREHIDTDDQLMIANSDQWVDIDIDTYLEALDAPGVDGVVMTMWADHPKWSYVRLDDDGRITEVVEKEVVSEEATVGIYNFASGRTFVDAADSMIAKDLRVNNEFYVAPVYNEMLATGAKITFVNVGSVGDGMYGLGTPEDLDEFLANPISRRAAAGRAV